MNFSLNPTAPLKAPIMGLLIILSVLLIGYFDWITGHEINFYVFYLIPISIATFYYQKKIGYSLSLFSIIIWFVVNNFPNHYSSYLYGYWNGLIRLITFCSFVWFISKIRYFVESEINLRKNLERSLEETKKKSEHIEELQKQIQTVCAWTHRIKDEGQWISFEEYLDKHFKMKFSHGISDEALKQLLEETDAKSSTSLKDSR